MLLVLVIAAAATWWLGARRPAPPAPTPAPAAIPSAPGDWEAYDRGIALVRAERYAEALPYLERGLNDGRWETYHDLAATLVNWTSAGRTRAGHEVPISRSSWERIAATHRALALVEHARTMTSTDRDRADLLGFRAMVLSSWGLGWDAMIDYQNMVAIDSTWALAIASRNLQARKMRYPEHE